MGKKKEMSIEEIRAGIVAEKMKAVDRNSKSSTVQVDKKEGSFNYESGTFE